MFALLKKFWPDNPYRTTLVNDHIPYCWPPILPVKADFFTSNETSWCQVLADFASDLDDNVLVLQEDFFLNAPVNQELVEHGLKILSRDNIGAVRLYPCPGSEVPSEDPYFGPVPRHTRYRNSLQATIYKPGYLHAIASRFNTPAEFEVDGSAWASQHLPAEVWAFKREVKPWPMEYYCSAISRGLWEPAALEFCRQQGVEVDTSMRGVAS